MADPTLTVDLVHAELSLDEVLAFAKHALSLFGYVTDLAHKAYCALPFVRAC